MDPVKNAVGRVEDQVVGQTKDDQTGGAKPGITMAVAQGPWEMRGTIRLDDETSILAEAVDDERSDGCWRRNLARMTCRSRSICQSIRSAGVQARRRARAMQVRGLGKPGMQGSRRGVANRCLRGVSGSPLRPGEGLGVRFSYP